jgi:hypothetical protein
MCPLSQRKEIQQLRDIVSPDVRIVALLPKAGPNRCTLFLHDGALIGYRLRGPYVADELLQGSHCGGLLDPTRAVFGKSIKGRLKRTEGAFVGRGY